MSIFMVLLNEGPKMRLFVSKKNNAANQTEDCNILRSIIIWIYILNVYTTTHLITATIGKFVVIVGKSNLDNDYQCCSLVIFSMQTMAA
jgi:hypothetical protein